MISELKLANFRCFDEEVTVRIRPITVILGENNAGKSSLLKCLLMLKQSMNASDQVYLNPNREEVVLGGIEALRNRTTKQDLALTLSVNEYKEETPPASLHTLRTSGQKANSLSYSVEALVNYSESLSSGKESIVFRENGNELDRVQREISSNIQFLSEKTGQDSEGEPKGAYMAGRIKGALSKIAYLSAARSEFLREVNKFRLTTGYVGKQGENTVLELWHKLYGDSGKKKCFLKHMSNVLNIKNIDIRPGENFIVCRAQSPTTKRMVNIADFGFGVSQCMPIFVQGLLMNPYSQLMVEQPEAQVHPTAQLEMGSFFSSLWNEHHVGSIIETHSANLLLRLQHDVKNKKLRPEEVSIAYLYRKGRQVRIKNLGIDSSGVLEDGVPLEFFDQSLLEMIDELDVDGEDIDEKETS